MRRRGWHRIEEDFLIKNYADMTIKELSDGLRKLSGRYRTDDSINAKIKRLKAEGKIKGQKEDVTVQRSLIQRRSKNGQTRQEFM